MVILRIRQAETAMADGRLDEAFDLAIRDDVRRHRRGQKLISRLVDRLLERGQAHVQDGQLEPALADFQRAARLGGNQLQIAKLRQEALAALDTRHAQARRRNAILNAVRCHVERGELSVGAKIAEQLDEQDSALGRLSEDIAVKRAAVEAGLERAEQAMERQAFDSAIRELLDVRRIQPNHARLSELTDKVTEAMVARIRETIGQGRLDLAASLLGQLKPLAEGRLPVTELERLLHECCVAVSWLEKGNVHQALHALTCVGQLMPDVHWIQRAIERTEQASASLDAIRGGPLGLIRSLARHEGGPAETTPGFLSRARPQPSSALSPDPPGKVAMNDDSLPPRFLMQVDGAGSFLVARSRVTTIGPISSSERPDVGLLAPADLPSLSIERMDEDYFLRCNGSVRVNDKRVSEKLLNDGDRIALAPRFEIRFRLPNAASTSAILELTGARLPRQDVRRVILLDESLIVGRGAAAHIPVRGLDETVVLHLRHGQLHCRCGADTRRNGPLQAGSTLAMNAPMQIGPVSLVITEIGTKA